MKENQLVVFRLGEEEYGMDILGVKEIIRYQKTVKVPDSPDFIEGIINYRDSVVPIMDLNKRFRLTGKGLSDTTRVIIVNMGGKQVGLMVDQVEEVLRINESSIEATPEVVAGVDRQYIRGIGKLEGRLIIILDVERVLTEGEKQELQQIQ
ncbi:MAG: Positive regulator of CheA protein activity (CheW) [Firmicutes bacterium]|nr:Positive regulator of CheA protein activity (CheW) [Bacillota bacterium]MDI6707182.1 chemotaxis protein CheW [Bacillota bacterium]